jgi:hypothetical protein
MIGLAQVLERSAQLSTRRVDGSMELHRQREHENDEEEA